MIKKSYQSLKYTNYNEYNVINVWTSNEKREAIVKRLLLTDKNFKLTSLQVNPLYKPVFDKLDALAIKKLNELDKSILWSRHYTKTEFKYSFVYPLIVFSVIIFCTVSKYGSVNWSFFFSDRFRKISFRFFLMVTLSDHN